MNELRILQLNCYRSAAIIQSLLNNPAAQRYHILCIQEPFAIFESPVGHPLWLPVGMSGPSSPSRTERRITPLPPHPRVLTYINKGLQTANASMVGVTHPDLQTVHLQLRPPQPGTTDGAAEHVNDIFITNLYNPNRSADTMPVLQHQLELLGRDQHHLVVGDYNAHHSLWESKTLGSSRFAQQVVETTDHLGLTLITPRDCPTYESREGRFSTIDLAFGTDRLVERVLRCSSLAGREPGEGLDHLPVEITLNLSPVEKVWPVRYNLKKCDAKQLATAVEQAWNERVGLLVPLVDAEGAESWAAALQGAVVAGLEESAPQSRTCSKIQPWFDHNASRSAMNAARRTWQASRGRVGRLRRDAEAEHWEQCDDANKMDCVAEANRLRYAEAKRAHYTSIRQSKKNHQRQALATADGRDLWRLAALGKGGGNAAQIAPLAMPEGGMALLAPAKAQVLRAGLWPAVTEARDESEDDDAASEFSLASDAGGGQRTEWKRFAEREVAERIGRSKRNSAPGPDGITWEALRMVMRNWSGFVPALCKVFSACLDHGVHPSVFKTATTVILRKPGTPDYSVPGAYRPIALLNVLGNLLEALVSERILAMAEHQGLLLDNHYGGRPQRSTEDALLRWQQFLADNHHNKRNVLAISVDVSGAYNGVRRAALVGDLRRAGWPSKVIAWAASFMEQRSTSLRLGDYTSEQMQLPDGLPQGSPVSQLLWLAYSRGLADAVPNSRTSMSIAWVDDVTVAFAADNSEDLQKAGQQYLDDAAAWAEPHGAAFDIKKTGACVFHRPRVKEVGPLNLVLCGRPVASVDSLKILCVTFQEDGKFTKHASNIVKKATKATGALLSRGNRAWGFGIDQARRLYEVGVMPIIKYASTVWLKPPGTGPGSKGMLNELAKVQRLAAIKITAAFRSTASEVLDFEAGIPPLDLKIAERQEKAFIRLVTLPKNHPLTPILERARHRPVSRLPGPLHQLCIAFPHVAHAKIERRLLKRVPGSIEVHQPSISATKEAAAERHQEIVRSTFETTLHVYTDGSGLEGRFGAAVHVVNPWVVRGGFDGARIGLGSKATVYRAEATAVLDALNRLPADQDAHIWSDSQAVLQAIGAADATDHTIRLIQERWLVVGDRVRISWVPGHMGILGNEEADEMAKAASRLVCDDEREEVADLRLRATRNTTQRWQERWDEGTKGGGDFRKVNKLAVGETRKLYKGLDRATVSLLVQLRTGHLGLNKYLKWRKVLDDPRCDRCRLVETREHLLFSCCRTRRAREALEADMGWRRARSTWALLNSRDMCGRVAGLAAKRLTPYKVAI